MPSKRIVDEKLRSNGADYRDAAGRYNTALEAAGAEHLVIGRLLIDRIQAFRAHANQPGYDLFAVDPKSQRSLRIQVKSRVATDSGAFKIGSYDFDFVVFVRLNRGTKVSLREGNPKDERSPEFYVVARDAIERSGERPPVRIPVSRITSYLERWDLIQNALRSSPASST